MKRKIKKEKKRDNDQFFWLPAAPYFHYNQDDSKVEIRFNREDISIERLKICRNALDELIQNFSQERVDEINGTKPEMTTLEVDFLE